MNSLRLIVAALLGTAAFPVFAQCTPPALTNAQINTLVTGNTVCGRPVSPGYPGAATDRWQEEHLGSAQLWDYKRGPGHPVDPRKQVGTWSTGGASTTDSDSITHLYSPTVAFTWVVYGPATNVPGSSVYSFCTTGPTKVEQVRAYVVPSGVGCSAYPP